MNKFKNFILLILNKNYKIILLNYLLLLVTKYNFIQKLLKFFISTDSNIIRYKFKIYDKSYLCLMNSNDLRAIKLYFNNTQINKLKLIVALQEKFKFDYFYDFGGNYGEFSIVSADIFEKVYYFEPNPDCVFFLKKTLKEIFIDNFIIYEKAIVKNSTNFTYLKVGKNSGGSRIFDNSMNDAIKVETINISEIFNSFDKKNESPAY